MRRDYDARSDASSQLPYSLLKQIKTDKPPKAAVEIYSSLQTVYKLKQILEGITGLVVVDIESKGLQAAHPDFRIVGIGLATADRILYFARPACSDSVWSYLLEWLASPDLILCGHNIFFDSAGLKKESGLDYNWRYCTYGLLRQLSTEGWPGQEWGLKPAQINLLGWQDTNQIELAQWLLDNGYTQSISKDYKDGSVRVEYPGEFDTEIINEETQESKQIPKVRYLMPDYGEMWRAPADILGYYCGLDCASTYMLLTEVLLPAISRLPPRAQELIYWYHCEVFTTNVRLNVEQQLRGLKIDKDKLIKHNEWLVTEIKLAEQNFFNHPQIKAAIIRYNQLKVQEIEDAKPEKYLKLKLPREPKIKVKKNGEISKAWLEWDINYKKALAEGPAISKHYLKWEQKLEEAKQKNHFNINSGKQRQWLFYTELGYPVIIRTKNKKDRKAPGQPATDKKALLGWGEPGKLLKYNNDLVKEQSYVQSCLDNLIKNADDTYCIHPQFQMPGTLTGRLAGSGGINIQQLPGSQRYLSCWRARENFVLVACDHDALENIVTTQLTKDKSLWKLYGPGQPPNDGHLFTGSAIPGLKEKILAAGYNPNNPTLEGIKNASKEAKKERAIAKKINYSSVYGAGANKIRQELALEGIKLTLEEAEAMLAAYWELYKGVKQYEAYLLKEWKKRGGWIYNGIGRPIGLYGQIEERYGQQRLTGKLKDIVNSSVQSTGHDLQMIWVYELYCLFKERNLTAYPWIVDFHDASIFEVKTEYAQAVLDCFPEAYRRLNEWLQAEIPIKGTAKLADNLYEAK
jgi:DNA polymerase I-like protein with 3'-5' exonuclease and polymerase domains